MSSYQPSALPNTRIDVADLLRGVAVAGIVMLHFIEHLNFYNFPPLTKLDNVVWDVMFFMLSNKMYAIFAMLFGLTLFVQHDNQAKRGYDFRPRFVWRMVLLFGFGLLDLLFFNGDILTVYAVCGLLVLPFVRAGNRVLLFFAVLFALQPIELAYLVGGLVDPQLQPLDLGSGAMFQAILPAQEGGSWFDVAMAGLCYVAFAVLCPLRYTVPQMSDVECVSASLTVMLDMWKNLAMMFFYVSLLTWAYHRTRARRVLAKILPYGKMSLSNYLGQSVVGGFIFYNWGLGLYAVSGHTMSLVLGVAFVLLQFSFCKWWFRSHKRGPLEQVWHNATWAGSDRQKK